MIEKVVEIKNIGRIRNYAANGDVSFRKLTLFYAENGRGKTTLCAILRSFQSGQAKLIAERKTLGATDPPFVHLRLNRADYKFTNDAWTDTYSDIVIFDPVFINDNVYSGDYVEHEHKKNLYRVIVGARGVVLAKQIEDLDRQIRDANPDLSSKKRAVEKDLPVGTTLEDYLQWQSVTGIETQIQQKSEELVNRKRAAAKSGEIQAKGLLMKVQIPSLPSDFATVLAKQLTDIVADGETKVRDQIARHEMGHQGESWLSQGLGYVKDDRCPFCGHGVRANDMIAAYRSHFSAAYGTLKQEVAQLSQHVNTSIGEMSLASAQQAISGNAALVEFWKQFVTVDLPVISFAEIQQKYATLREQCLVLATKKQDSPTEAVAADAEEAAKDEVWGGYRYAVIADSQEPDGLKTIDLGAGHSSSGETLCGRVITALKSQALLNESVGAGYIERNWPPALKESGAWPLASLRQSFLNGSLTRLLDPDTILRGKIVEFVFRGDFGLASGQKPDGTYERVWFSEPIAQEEAAFESGVFLFLKSKAKTLRATPEPEPGPEPSPVPEPEPEPPPGPGPEPEPVPSAETRTFKLSGDVPPEIWNRLGSKVLPKLRSGSDLKIGIEFSVTVEGQLAQSFQADLKQILDDLGLVDRVRVETTEERSS